MAFDVLVRAFFTDSGLSAGLAKANDQLAALGRSGPGARTGLRLAETGMRTLAFEAAGVSGPLGRIAAGLLSLGGGNALVVGAAAGIGVIALAYRSFTASARDAQKAHEDFLKALEKTPEGKALAGRVNLRAEQDKLAGMERRQAIADAAGRTATGGLFSIGGFNPNEMEAQRNKVAQLTMEATAAEGVALEARMQKEREWQRTLYESAAALSKLELGLHPTNEQLADLDHQSKLVTISLSGLAPEHRTRLTLLENERSAIERVNAATKDRQARDDQRRKDEAAFPTVGVVGDLYYRARLGQGGNVTKMDSGTPYENTIRGRGEMSAGTYNPGPSTGKAEEGKVDAQRLAAESVALLGALKQGGAAGIFAGLGSVASDLGGLKNAPAFLGPVGIGLSVVSGIVGMLDNGADRRHREQMAVLKRIAEKPMPEGRTLQPIYVGANASNAGQVGYEVGRFQDRDGFYRGVGGGS